MPSPSPEELMKIALEEARSAAAENEVPVGAVLDAGDGCLIKAHNRSEALGPLAARRPLRKIGPHRVS